jgi:hypothetical protein
MPFRSPHIAGGSRGSCPIRRATSPPTFNRSVNASAAEFVGIRRWLIHSASRRDSRSRESRRYVEVMLVTPIPPTRMPRTHSPRACSCPTPKIQRSPHCCRALTNVARSFPIAVQLILVARAMDAGVAPSEHPVFRQVTVRSRCSSRCLDLPRDRRSRASPQTPRPPPKVSTSRPTPLEPERSASSDL